MRILIFLVSLSLFTGCTRKSSKKALWLYTSIYKEVISELTPALEKQFPGVTFHWYQSGSENVAARINAELMTGRSKADLVLTSDPFWYLELSSQGHLLPIPFKPRAVVSDWLDPSSSFATVRLPIAVIAYNSESYQLPPRKWSELLDKRYVNKISMGSPVESGTAFNVVSQLARAKGWDFFSRLRKNGILVAGGNSAVIHRIETRERPIGITLLENVLEARKRGSPVNFVYPDDGSVWVPSPIAVLAKTQEPELAKAVYRYFFSDEIQEAFIRGRMYSPVLTHRYPDGVKPYEWVLKRSLPWNHEVLASIFSQREEIKRRFVETVMN